MENFNIRDAKIEDVEVIYNLMKEFGDYLNMSDAITIDVETMKEHLFHQGVVKTLLSEVNGVPMGYAMVYPTYASFSGEQGLFLEDLYISPAYRGKGYGKALIQGIFDLAGSGGYQRVDWECLMRNVNAREFYKALGAKEKEKVIFQMRV